MCRMRLTAEKQGFLAHRRGLSCKRVSHRGGLLFVLLAGLSPALSVFSAASGFTAAFAFCALCLAAAATSCAPCLVATATSCAASLAATATSCAPSFAASATTFASCLTAVPTALASAVTFAAASAGGSSAPRTILPDANPKPSAKPKLGATQPKICLLIGSFPYAR